MSLLGFALVAVGIWGLGWGVYTAFSAPTGKSAKAWLGAFVAPLALLTALCGSILVFVPTFFK